MWSEWSLCYEQDTEFMVTVYSLLRATYCTCIAGRQELLDYFAEREAERKGESGSGVREEDWF